MALGGSSFELGTMTRRSAGLAVLLFGLEKHVPGHSGYGVSYLASCGGKLGCGQVDRPLRSRCTEACRDLDLVLPLAAIDMEMERQNAGVHCRRTQMKLGPDGRDSEDAPPVGSGVGVEAKGWTRGWFGWSQGPCRRQGPLWLSVAELLLLLVICTVSQVLSFVLGAICCFR